MNREELQNKLNELKINKYEYSLNGGLPNEAFCLEEDNNNWFVYYSERGSKSGLKKFSDEKKACNYFYTWLLKNIK